MKSLVAALLLSPILALARPVLGGGIPFTRETPAPAAAVEPARKALADQLDGTTPAITAARLDLGQEALLAWVESGRLCGNEIGCPSTILVRQGASWRAVWTGTSFGRGPCWPVSMRVSTISRSVRPTGCACLLTTARPTRRRRRNSGAPAGAFLPTFSADGLVLPTLRRTGSRPARA
jgi:hypothetical protein